MRHITGKSAPPLLFGVMFGIFYALAGYLNPISHDYVSPIFVDGVILIFIIPLVLYFTQRLIRARVLSHLLNDTIIRDFYRFESYTYAVFLLGIFFPLGLEPGIELTILLYFLVVLTQAVILIRILTKFEKYSFVISEYYIIILFLFSGFSALTYQVVWQRVLFTTFGVNSESVTIIVSVFMFGLGVGALAGGFIQKKFPNRLLRLFLLIEISIGLFGVSSLNLIQIVSDLSVAGSNVMLIFWVYAILALPTLLMGATLPILVSFMQKYFRNIGKTVGVLYAFNTIGSAIAAFITVQILFVYVGLKASILIAAACNFMVAFLIFNASKRFIRNEPILIPEDVNQVEQDSKKTARYFYLSFVALILVGFISLSQEILWFRLLGYMTANQPQVFGMILTCFLIGIAIGSLKSKSICENDFDKYTYLRNMLFYAFLIFYLAIPFIAFVTSVLGKTNGLLWAYCCIALVAYFTGGVLPVLMHMAVKNNSSRSALSVSWLYFANIIGATVGPLLTGFYLLDKYSLEENVVIISGLTLALFLLILLISPKPAVYKAKLLSGVSLILFLGLFTHAFMYKNFLEKIQYASTPVIPFKYKLENKAGILTVESGIADTMYGNGIYDGRFNVSPISDSNGIDRAYMIAALHRNPQKILEIGLSTGSWTKVISDYQPLQHLTVVEINKGYQDIAMNYPENMQGLNSPKVNIVVDDGRRWLNRHPDEKFDFIVMNNSFYWRSNSTNLLSKDFLEICKKHLNPSGVIYYNTTSSKDVIYTAAHVFNYVTTYKGFVAASDSPFDLTPEEKRSNFMKFLNNRGEPFFNQDQAHQEKLLEYARTSFPNIKDGMLSVKKLWLITDDNMAIEYKVH